MKITFIKDHQSVLSGHSFYTAGTQADLRRGPELIDLGVAREGWEPETAIEETAVTKPKPAAKRKAKKKG